MMLTSISAIFLVVLLIWSMYFFLRRKFPRRLVYKKIVNTWFSFVGWICCLWMMLIGSVAVVYFIPSQVDYKLISSLSSTGWSTEFSINVLQGMGTSLSIFWIFILIVMVFKIGKINNVTIWHYTKEEEVINKLEEEENKEKLKNKYPLLYKIVYNKYMEKLNK